MSGPPVLRPVRFDQDAAEEAARQLLVTAESLFECLAGLGEDWPIVTEDWEGHFRDTFDHEFAGTVAGGHVLVDMLRQMAAVIRARAWEAAAADAAYWRQQAELQAEAG
jgi:uncharacterized protein YukE